LVQHGPAVGGVAIDVGVFHEGFGDRVCVVISVRKVKGVIVRRQDAGYTEELDTATLTLSGTSTALIQERLEVRGDLIGAR
jgi:hypothetical protein